MNNPPLYSLNGSYPLEAKKLPEPHNTLTHEELLKLGYVVKPWYPSIRASQILVWTGVNWLKVENPDYVPPSEPNPWPLPVPPEDPSKEPVGNVIFHGTSTYEWSGTEWVKIG